MRVCLKILFCLALLGSGRTVRAAAPGEASTASSWLARSPWQTEEGLPGGGGPTRNKQGIISYEIYASSYPSFAVRGPDQTFVMATPTRTNNTVQLTWAAVPGRTYTIYHSPTLNAAAWTSFGTNRCNGTTGTLTDTNLTHTAQGVGFYKASYQP